MWEYSILVVVVITLFINVALIAITLTILLRHQQHLPPSTPPIVLNDPRDLDIFHMTASIKPNDEFLYDGTYYILRLREVRLSSPNVQLKYSTVISHGYLSVETTNPEKYVLSKNGLKIVYHDNIAMFLVVPISYTHEWLHKGFININNGKYILDSNLFVVASIDIPETTYKAPLPLPEKPTIHPTSSP